MRPTALAPLLLAALVAPMPSQNRDDPCPSQLVHWSVADRLVEGWLVAPAEAGQPLQVRQNGVKGTKELGWNTPRLACFVRKGSRGTGALIGLGAGALAGAVIGFGSGDDNGDCMIMCTASQKAAGGAMTLGLLGAVIGVAAKPGSVWTPLKPSSNARAVGLYLSVHGVGLQVRF